MDADDRLNKMLGKKENTELNRVLGKKGQAKEQESVRDIEYEEYNKKNFPNSKRKTCPKCGDKHQMTHYNYCDQCGYKFEKEE